MDAQTIRELLTNVAKVCATSPINQGETGIVLILPTRFMQHVLLFNLNIHLISKSKIPVQCNIQGPVA